MKKQIYIIIITLSVCLLNLNSCSIWRSRLDMLKDYDKKADSRMEQIMAAVKNKNRETLKSLFSKQALEEAVNFDSDVDHLFDFIQGNVESWERDGLVSEEALDYGKRSIMIIFAINIITDKERYSFFVIDYNTDTINPNNQGLYMLEVTLPDSDNVGSWRDRMRAGIYIH